MPALPVRILAARAVFVRFSVLLALATSAPLCTVNAATWSHDASVNLQIVKLPGEQCVDDMVSDGGHGAIVFWADPCGDPLTASPPAISLHSQHVLGNGEFDPAWNTAALPGTNNFFGYILMTDGAGGAFVGWADQRNVTTTGRDLYLQHVRSNGTPDPAWPVGGRPVCTAVGTQITPELASDGSGGVLLVWTDRRDSLTTGSDLYAAHVRFDGTLDPAWTANGAAVCKTASIQQSPRMTADGAHGAFVEWSDLRNGATGSDIYAGHLLANGSMDPAWPANGRAVFVGTGSQSATEIAADGAGGAFVSWHDSIRPSSIQHVLANGTLDPAWPAPSALLDATATALDDIQLVADGGTGLYVLWDAVTTDVANNDVYARHLLANGTSDPSWPANPLRLEPGPSNKAFGSSPRPLTLADGSMLFDWQDDRYGGEAVFVGRLLPGGSVDGAWPTGGRLLFASGGDYPGVLKAADGRGGAIYTWTDLRDFATTNYDIYGDRLGADGLRGVDQPDWHALRDVAGDQGGHVMLEWYWSSYDNMPADPLTAYNVWRRLDALAVTPARAARALPASSALPPRAGDVRVRGTGATSTFWEFMATVPPRGVPGYSLAVQTRADSIATDTAWETYEVDAVSAGTAYGSDPDSGYSVDNLAPPAPTGFAGAFAKAGTSLVWDPLLVYDLASYRLYRGTSAGFTPAAGNRIATPTTTHYTDASGLPWVYKLTGVDVHGNEGPTTALLPTGTTSVGDGALPATVSLALRSPSPARTGATFAIGLPRDAFATLAVFDAAGRRVRTLVAGAAPAGTRTTAWDLHDDAGHAVGDGLYFIRLDAAGVRRTARLAVIR